MIEKIVRTGICTIFMAALIGTSTTASASYERDYKDMKKSILAPCRCHAQGLCHPRILVLKPVKEVDLSRAGFAYARQDSNL